jgi:hypothetical protein
VIRLLKPMLLRAIQIARFWLNVSGWFASSFFSFFPSFFLSFNLP